MLGSPSSVFEPHDIYSVTIVEDLLGGTGEWRSIEDIVRLTLKALTDVVKTQGVALREVENQLSNRPTRNELNDTMGTKAERREVDQLFTELQRSVEKKASRLDVEDKVSLPDIKRIMSEKASVEEVANLIETRVRTASTEENIQQINDRVDDMHRDLLRRIESLPTSEELNAMKTRMGDINASDLDELLEGKANKQSVANALHRKANKADVDTVLSQKADLQEIQILISAIESKAEHSWVEQIGELMDEKVDRSEITQKILPEVTNKIDRKDLEIFHKYLNEHKQDTEEKFRAYGMEMESYVKQFKSDLEDYSNRLDRTLGNKADLGDLEKLEDNMTHKTEI